MKKLKKRKIRKQVVRMPMMVYDEIRKKYMTLGEYLERELRNARRV